jgi:putative component of membrane protein insertase Oxa1/YidC/SpoIIIJ protein YidD
MKTLIIQLIILSYCTFSNVKGQSDNLYRHLEKDVYIKLTELEVKQNKRVKGGVANALLNFYQNYLSVQFSSECIYSPSCSAHSREAFQKYNFIKSIFISTDRITRCSGWVWKETPDFLINKDGLIEDHP